MMDYGTLVPKPQDVQVIANSFSINLATKILVYERYDTTPPA